MGERTRRHVQREAAPTRSPAPTRSSDDDATDRPTTAPNPLLELQATAGNRAVAALMLQRDAGDNVVTVQTPAEAANDLLTAEDWVRFVAWRGNVAAPGKAVPSRYRSQVTIIQAAVGGPGPIPAADVAATATALGGTLDTMAKAVIGRMQAERTSLLPKTSTNAYDTLDLALELGEQNRKEHAGPTSAQDQGLGLLGLQTSAEEEIEARAGRWLRHPQGACGPAVGMCRHVQVGEGRLEGRRSHRRADPVPRR